MKRKLDLGDNDDDYSHYRYKAACMDDVRDMLGNSFFIEGAYSIKIVPSRALTVDVDNGEAQEVLLQGVDVEITSKNTLEEVIDVLGHKDNTSWEKIVYPKNPKK